MSDHKGRPLNEVELNKVSDVVTDSKTSNARQLEKKQAVDIGVSEKKAVTALKKTDKRFGLFGIFSVLFGGLWRISRIFILIGIIIGSLFFSAYVLQQDDLVRSQFEGKRWALPARVFARPLELYEGQSLSSENLQKELQLLGYSYVTHLVGTGQYTKKNDSFQIQTRGFKFSEDVEISRRIQIDIKENQIIKLRNTESSEALTLMRLEPVLIGNFYPQHNEDRVLVRFNDVTPLLTKGLVAVEDKKFYQHFGVNPKSIVRAVLANAEAGKKVQGASTLTQQLVKNFFLTSEKSYKRKAQEAIMAMLLEVHYDKKEILEAYLNEIYLGQNGKRAVHGFGLASQFYFNKPINELKTEQVALLIGLAKGPSVYNPRKYPDKAIERRNLVLDVMAREGVLVASDLARLKAMPLGVSDKAPPSVSPFPSYLELVRKQLQRDYQEKDLNSTGLLIFTSMDPVMQIAAETVLQERIGQLEKQVRAKKDKLNGAMVVSSVQGGEVLAVVGGRDARFAGYNRALSASRQIGSLIKPAIYLTALESGDYTLASPIDSGPVTVRLSESKTWKPKNYEGKNLGIVPFEKGLIKSLNTPTVRIGINLGLDRVIKTIQDLGLNRNIAPNPSLLLGAIQLTPLEVQQMYQTFAAGGTYTPLKAIRSVMNSYGETLKSYPLIVNQVVKEESMYLVNYAMNKITTEGTARYLKTSLPEWKNSAGKTGTTNKNVDSWYAGFTGSHVVSVWVGRDDNKPSGLTGSSGALRVWSDFIGSVDTKPFKPVKPKAINFMNVDKMSGLLFNSSCGNGHIVPFASGTEPSVISPCAQIFDSMTSGNTAVWASESTNAVFSEFAENDVEFTDGGDLIVGSPKPQANTQTSRIKNTSPTKVKKARIKKQNKNKKRKRVSRNTTTYNSETDSMNLSESNVILQNHQSYDSPIWTEALQ